MDPVFRLESYDAFRMATEEILTNVHRSSQLSGAEIDSNVLDAAKDCLRTLIIKHNFDIDDVAIQIQNNNWNLDRVKYFVSLLKEKKSFIFYSIIRYNNRLCGDTLVDFDWLLKFILGTSESKCLRYPVLQIILNSVNTSGDQMQRMYEMNKESLTKLIKTLEGYQTDVEGGP